MANWKGLFMYEVIKYFIDTLKIIVISGCVVSFIVGCVAIIYIIINKLSK